MRCYVINYYSDAGPEDVWFSQCESVFKDAILIFLVYTSCECRPFAYYFELHIHDIRAIIKR